MIWLAIVLLLFGIAALIFGAFMKPGIEERAAAFTIGGIASMIGVVMFVLAMIVVVPPGNVGVQSKFGTINPKPIGNGLHFINPFSSVRNIEVRTFEYTMSSSVNEGAKKGDDSIRLFSKDVLPMDADITVMWRPSPEMVPWLFEHIGDHDDYVNKIIRPSSRSAFRNSVVQFTAQEAITSARETLSLEVARQMKASINKILASNENYRSRKSTKIYKFEFQSLSIPLSAVRLSTLVLMD